MNDLPRQKLIEIVGRHGKSIVGDARRAEGLFRDNFGGFRREISVLTMAVEEGVAQDLAVFPSNSPRQVLLARLKQRLIDNLALSEDAAKWSVESWALALGVVSSDDLNVGQKQLEPQIPQVVAPVIQNKTTKPQTAKSNEIIVSADGSGDFDSITAAIKAAQINSRISVRAGLYEESLIVNKQIEIVGDGSVANVVVRSLNSSCIKFETERAVVRNLTLQCAAAQSGKKAFGVEILNGEITIQNCDVTSDSLACVAVHGANTKLLMRDCLIRDSADGGIYFFDSATGNVEESEIYRNRNASVVIAQNANPTFKNCRITAGGNAGFWVYENGLGTIDDSEVFGHRRSEIVVASGGSPVFRGCKIHNSNESGVFVGEGGRILIEECSIYENADAGVSVDGASIAAARNCHINGNGKVAIRVKDGSSVRVENSDLRGNLLATWETEHGVFVENNNNLEY
jgi:hypothetical protein